MTGFYNNSSAEPPWKFFPLSNTLCINDGEVNDFFYPIHVPIDSMEFVPTWITIYLLIQMRPIESRKRRSLRIVFLFSKMLHALVQEAMQTQTHLMLFPNVLCGVYFYFDY